MSKQYDRLSIDKNDAELYEKIKSENIFNDKENKDLFLIAMIYGFRNKSRENLQAKYGFVRTEYLKNEDWALINSIAESYAHAGIRLLAAKIKSVAIGSFEKHFEKELFDTFYSFKNRV